MSLFPVDNCAIHMKLVILNLVQVDEGFPVSYDLCVVPGLLLQLSSSQSRIILDICKCNLFLLVPDFKCLEAFKGKSALVYVLLFIDTKRNGNMYAYSFILFTSCRVGYVFILLLFYVKINRVNEGGIFSLSLIFVVLWASQLSFQHNGVNFQCMLVFLES